MSNATRQMVIDDPSKFKLLPTYDDAFKNAHGETVKERETMAIQILRALEDIQKYLEKLGFSPR